MKIILTPQQRNHLNELSTVPNKDVSEAAKKMLLLDMQGKLTREYILEVKDLLGEAIAHRQKVNRYGQSNGG